MIDSINTKFKFIIFTPPLDFKVGGIVVLHHLAKLLNDFGQQAMLYSSNNSQYKNVFCSRFASLKDIDDSTIVVYPEVVEGNPLQAKHVVRWILCELGAHTSRDIYKTWGESDLVFHFSTYNNKCDANSVEILYTPWIDPAVKNQHLPRSGSCYLFKKASAFHSEIKLIHPKEALMVDTCSYEEMIAIFNTTEYLYCYDPYSFCDILAALCGCIPIIYPLEGVSKSDWLNTRGSFPKLMEKRGNLAGIAYGLQDIPYARSTLSDIHQDLECIMEFARSTILNFLQRSTSYFFHDAKTYPYRTVSELSKLWSLEETTLNHVLHQKNREIRYLKQTIQKKQDEMDNLLHLQQQKENEILKLKSSEIQGQGKFVQKIKSILQ